MLAIGAAAFDKNLPWGKRDYPCVNVYQGIPDNSTIAMGTEITLKFNRQSTQCNEALNKYPGSPYSLWLYNNPVRHLDDIDWDANVKLADKIAEKDGTVTFAIPRNLTAVKDNTVWYMRLSTVLATAPQMPSLFNAAGPFTIHA
ncbi:hypothetical protein BDV59DRAFT_202916 [Aspergillus ambiguus]|uniref:uncharacterized protein n=1 Tax=Aspergillus ambiguus TaxID=176160 RepID=UPI003CCE306E